jgi:transketolase
VCICAHAGIETGEDGPSHADPQALQLLQENFPPKVMITLTPWEPQEVWPLLAAGVKARPAVLAPFVTRPSLVVLDRADYGLPPASECVSGVYALRLADPSQKRDGTVVIQGSGVTYAFVMDVLPELEKRGVNVNVFYVSSPELFDLLPRARQRKIFSFALAREAMGITDFTMPTLYRWVTSEYGRTHSIHPFRNGRYLGSGLVHKVLGEAGLDGPSQLKAVMKYVEGRRSK